MGRTSKFVEGFVKNYNEDSVKGCKFEVDVEYPKGVHDMIRGLCYTIHNGLPFSSERMEIKKCQKFVCYLHNKEKCVLHIRTLKQALNYGLILKKMHRMTTFNQKMWLEKYIDLNTKLKTEAKNDFEKKRLFLT